jgi:hypothetical protein
MVRRHHRSDGSISESSCVPFDFPLAWPKGKVEVVGHQAECKRAHGHVLLGVVQQFEEGVEIAILVKDGASAVTAVEDMVTIAAERNAKGTWHGCHYGPAQR